MKKIALTSLLAVFAISGAHAANVIDGNPLYMPKTGHAYSVTNLGSHSERTEAWRLNEEFGYGVSDKLTINVATTLRDEQSFDQWGWGELKLGAAFRALDMGAIKMDLIGAYTVDPVWGNHRPFLEEDDTVYTWTAGVRAGYTSGNFTIAGKALFNYSGAESFNWDDEGIHKWILGLDAQFVINNNLNLVAGAEYTGITDDGAKNAGIWKGEFGVNYNLDATKFVGAYINGTMRHATGDWEWDDGFGFGAKFGIDF